MIADKIKRIREIAEQFTTPTGKEIRLLLMISELTDALEQLVAPVVVSGMPHDWHYEYINLDPDAPFEGEASLTPVQVPPGWTLVPVDPTDAMIRRAMQYVGDFTATDATIIYRRMLAAVQRGVPPPPSS